MGASNCPETPRQKMIQMMYLVYTAMLALNVSAEVISGFITVGDAMSKSNQNIELKLEDSYTLFAEANKNNPEKTQEWYDKALEVKKLTAELKAEIDTLQFDFLCVMQSEAEVTDYNSDPKKPKTRTIPLVDKKTKAHLLDSAKVALEEGGLGVIVKADDNHTGSNYFYGTKDEANGKSIHLRDKIIEYKKALKRIMGEDSTTLQMDLNVEQRYWSKNAKQMVSWEQYNFNNTIAIADMVVLSRLKAEAMNAEFDAVNLLFKKVKQGDFSFDQIAVIVRPKSSYVIQGGTYEAAINVAAYDSKAHFEAEIGGSRQLSNDSGCVNIRRTCGATGQQTISGTVYVKNDAGPAKEYKFSENYFVAEPAAIVSLTNMNVVYAGIDNPVSVSVPGVDSRLVTPTIQEAGASIVKDPEGKVGDYLIKTTKTTGKIHVITNAKSDGKTNHIMGTTEFRIKKVPDPIIMLGKYKNGSTIPRSDLRVTRGFRATMGEDFSFKMKMPRVQSYSFNLSRSGKEDIEVKNNSNWTPDVQSMLKKAKPGQKIYIDNIKIKMADGSTRQTSATFRIGR